MKILQMNNSDDDDDDNNNDNDEDKTDENGFFTLRRLTSHTFWITFSTVSISWRKLLDSLFYTITALVFRSKEVPNYSGASLL